MKRARKGEQFAAEAVSRNARHETREKASRAQGHNWT